ncbi:YcjF family protein [Oceanospirillum sp.]|uniref:YcjF family protein n=1 Tax=Oceanospirillum sp. TaxID=2021254 RepID=UPI003A956E61
MSQKPGYIEPANPEKDDPTTNSSPTDKDEGTAHESPRNPGYAPEAATGTLKDQPEDAINSHEAHTRQGEAVDSEVQAGTSLIQGGSGIGKSVIAVVAVLLLLILTNELVSLWQSHWLLGALGSGVLVVVLLGVINVWRQERRSTEEIKRLKAEQDAVQQTLKNKDLPALKATLTPWLERQSKAAPQLIQRFKDAAVERTTTEEYWQLYQLMVLRELDQQAEKIIRHYTLTTGTAVMVIPHAGLDTLVVLWRSRTMTREIASVYGLQTTSLSAIRLFRQALVTVMVVAGVEALAQEKLLSEGSDELMNRILGGVSQSLITARRTYKLGRMIQLACRPYGVDR